MVGRRKAKNDAEIKVEDTVARNDTKINESYDKEKNVNESENKTEATEMKTEITENKTEATEMKTEITENKTEDTGNKSKATEIKTEATVNKTEVPENKAEDNWDATTTKKETTEEGWGSESKTEATEGGWGSETTTSAWDAPAPAINTESQPANDSYRENNNYRERDNSRSYKPRGQGDFYRDEYPRKRFDRGEYDNSRSSGNSYGQEKRFRSERDDSYRENNYRSRDRMDNYRSREDSYRSRDRVDDYRSRDRMDDYRPREDSYRSRENSYRPREDSYRPREDGYRSRGREGAYERSHGNRGAPSTYDPMSENGQQSYERRPKKLIPENVPPSKALGLFGLSLYATEDDLREFLAEELPEIKDFKLTIITDHETKKSRGFGFVYFQCLEDSIKAKECLTGKAIKGKEIRVDFSVSDVLRPNYR